MADKFWEYVAEYIEQINFTEIDDKQYDLLFSNVSTAIMGKIQKMFREFAFCTTLIFKPDFFTFLVPDSHKHLLPENTSKVVMTRNLIILSNEGNEYNNLEVETIYNASKKVTLPQTWFVVKYIPAAYSGDGYYEYDGKVLSTNNIPKLIDTIGEYQFSKLHIPIEYNSKPTKHIRNLYAELGIVECKCKICTLASIHSELNSEGLCGFCANLKLPEV